MLDADTQVVQSLKIGARNGVPVVAPPGSLVREAVAVVRDVVRMVVGFGKQELLFGLPRGSGDFVWGIYPQYIGNGYRYIININIHLSSI